MPSFDEMRFVRIGQSIWQIELGRENKEGLRVIKKNFEIIDILEYQDIVRITVKLSGQEEA